MDKGLFFMTLSLACLWIILDDFFGKHYISNLVSNLIPSDFGKIALPKFNDPAQAAKSKEEAKKKVDDSKGMSDSAKQAAKDAIDHFYGDVEVH